MRESVTVVARTNRRLCNSMEKVGMRDASAFVTDMLLNHVFIIRELVSMTSHDVQVG